MFERSSKCEKRNRFYNSEFAIENVSASIKRLSSTCFVSNLNVKQPKNDLKMHFYIFEVHRDIVFQRFTCLYVDQKPVFCCIRLASIDSFEKPSVIAITIKEVIVSNFKSLLTLLTLLTTITTPASMPFRTTTSKRQLLRLKKGKIIAKVLRFPFSLKTIQTIQTLLSEVAESIVSYAGYTAYYTMMKFYEIESNADSYKLNFHVETTSSSV